MNSDERYETLKKEVDSLQILLGKERGPWYGKSSVIIAVVALIFSFGTTVVSYVTVHQEDIRDNRREARQILQRLTKLPIENFELIQKNKNNALGTSTSFARAA